MTRFRVSARGANVTVKANSYRDAKLKAAVIWGWSNSFWQRRAARRRIKQMKAKLVKG
jgi:hypothetical protein